MSRDDFYYHKAKQEGYRSRASYKLLQIHEKFRIFRPRQLVLDLGASPGGWAQVASHKIGTNGRVIAVDRAYIPPFKEKNIEVVLMDIMNTELESHILSNFGKLDVVLSDCAPNVTGAWDRDQAVQIMLAERAFDVSKAILNKGGSLVCKIFQGQDYPNFVAKVKNSYDFVKLFKPKASRKKSAEIYMFAKERKTQDKMSNENERK